MAIDFVPMADSELDSWLTLLKASFTEQGANFNLDPTEIAAGVQLCNEYVAQISATSRARLKAKSEVTKKQAMRKTHLRPLRKLINKMKSAPGFINAEA